MLTKDQIFRVAPSVFAESPSEKTSDKYRFIPTSNVLSLLENQGFHVVHAVQNRVRIPGKREFTKHSLRFRHDDMLSKFGKLEVGQLIPELLLVNSHDGSSSFQFSAGIYRCVCSNQMCVPDSTIETLRVTHKGFNDTNVIDAAFEIVSETPKLLESIESMKAVDLTESEKLAFGRAAIELRWDGESKPLEPWQIIQPRRWGDKKNDLWTTFNAAQENLIKGGLRGRDSQGHRRQTVGVNSITENQKLNKALWQLAEEMKKLKA